MGASDGSYDKATSLLQGPAESFVKLARITQLTECHDEETAEKCKPSEKIILELTGESVNTVCDRKAT